jgi:hypothetical protein
MIARTQVSAQELQVKGPCPVILQNGLFELVSKHVQHLLILSESIDMQLFII